MDMTMSTRGEQYRELADKGRRCGCGIICGFRLSGRVKKKAMTTFERDRTMSKMSSQLDYKVCLLSKKMYIE